MHGGWHIEGLQVRASGPESGLILDLPQASFPPGAITILTGPNGAGKTTLLESMAGLRPLRTGRIHVDHMTLWQGNRLNRGALLTFGLSLQQSHAQWFAPSVREELRYSLSPLRLEERQINERMLEAMSVMGLEPQLLDSDPWHLSGGEQRRLALACAIILKPRWLLLDEPTAGLDAASIERLQEMLRGHRARGGGAVIVTHDWDALWPVADWNVVLQAGRMMSRRSRPEIAASWLEPLHHSDPPELSMPAEAAVLAALRRQGLQWPALSDIEPLPPERLAGLIASARTNRVEASTPCGGPDPAGAVTPPAQAGRPAESPEAVNDPRRAVVQQPSVDPEAVGGSSWSRRDPRILWVAYLLFSFGLLLQQDWSGLLLGGALTGVVLWQARASLTAWRGAIRIYILFAIIVVLVASVQLSPPGWNAGAASISAFRFARILLIMLLGLTLAQIVTPFRMQRALEQGLAGLTRLRMPVRELALVVSLIFRFIPMLTTEWERFARITRARGKSAAKPGRVPMNQLPRMLVPYLLSMLRIAEEISEAMEVRGLGRDAAAGPKLYRLRLQQADYLLLAAGIMVFLGLAAARSWL
ncbi:ATP-binding cassette domain-containing protein [Paenibacillus sp. 1P07SE]|uniref:ATP-binding cassette domain-containing protein n=1 Tax=Paenibacillus sp. 1P07SE TaxID=3132209 RepID=UPI0039A579C4